MNQSKHEKVQCTPSEHSLLKGIPVSPGIVIGNALVLDRDRPSVSVVTIDPARVEAEIQRFRTAIDKTKEEFASIQKSIVNQLGQEKAKIFDAHLLMLEDTMAIDETIERIRKEKKNAAFLFFQNVEKVRSILLKAGDAYMRERAVDLLDVERRVLRNLTEGVEEEADHQEAPHIIVANFLTPSDTAQLDRRLVLGFITELGGRTSHAAIVARSLGIPAVVGLHDVTQKVCSGDRIIVDGSRGVVLINPDEHTLSAYRERRELFIQRGRDLLELADAPATTPDGRTVDLQANIELPDEVEAAISHGAKGIGLYRTEYLYLARPDLPGEEEQYMAYASIAQRIAPDPVVIRTFDLGGDKYLNSINMPREPNPYLGWRAIRICLDRQQLFRTQLRAILRASHHGNVRIMFPMISGLGEFRRVKAILQEVQNELKRERVPFDEGCEIGVMIEVPSAALIADQLAREVNFFSIGTNDLIQYTIAVDRSNERTEHLFNPFHPAVLRLIDMVIQAGHEAGIWVGLCGEMAGDPLSVWMLLGMGLDEFSMSPVDVLEAKQLIRAITYEEAKQVAREALKLQTAEEIILFLKEQLRDRLGELPPEYELEWQWRDYGPHGE